MTTSKAWNRRGFIGLAGCALLTGVTKAAAQSNGRATNPTPTPSPTSTATATATATATETSTATPLPTSTSTPLPTETPLPTNTPVPTNTPLPTSTAVATGTVSPSATPTQVATATPTAIPTVSPTVTPVGKWSDIGLVSKISGSATARARIVVQIQPFNNQLFLGYGDWDDTAQKGCSLLAYSPSQAAILNYGHFATDAFWSHRVVNDQLFAMVTDPEVGTNPDIVSVSRSGSVGILQAAFPNPWHLFDAIAFNGRTFCAGSIAVDAKTDAQGIWGTYVVNSQIRWKILWKGNAGRCYGLFVVGGTLYGALSNGRSVKTTDGVTWTAGPSMTSQMVKPLNYKGGVVYRGNWPAMGSGTLYSFNGTSQSSLQSGVRDHYVDGSNLWTLKSDGKIYRDNVLKLTAPARSMSLAILDGTLYVGTSDSHLWSSRL